MANWEAFAGIPQNDYIVARMELCPEHWEMARQALISRGLGAYIPEKGAELDGEAQMNQLMNVDKRDSFDPLILYQNMVFRATLDKIGPISGCPICEMKGPCPCGKKSCTPEVREASWINKVADFIRDHALDIGVPLYHA